MLGLALLVALFWSSVNDNLTNMGPLFPRFLDRRPRHPAGSATYLSPLFQKSAHTGFMQKMRIAPLLDPLSPQGIPPASDSPTSYGGDKRPRIALDLLQRGLHQEMGDRRSWAVLGGFYAASLAIPGVPASRNVEYPGIHVDNACYSGCGGGRDVGLKGGRLPGRCPV